MLEMNRYTYAHDKPVMSCANYLPLFLIWGLILLVTRWKVTSSTGFET